MANNNFSDAKAANPRVGSLTPPSDKPTEAPQAFSQLRQRPNQQVSRDRKTTTSYDPDSEIKGLFKSAYGALFQGNDGLYQDLLDCRTPKEPRSVEAIEEFQRLFARFLAASADRKCLSLLAGDQDEPELGPNWVTVDVETVEHRAREAGMASIDLDDEFFDVVLCTGLDRISRPASLVKELWRVLKRGGEIWVQVPLNEPYSARHDAVPTAYWRITPEGLRVLFERFDEILCSVHLPSGRALRNSSFFYGLKPQKESEDDEQWAKAVLSTLPM